MSNVALRPELKGTPKPVRRGYQNDTSREAQEWYLANGMCPTVMYSNDRSMRFWICEKPIKTEGADKCNTHLGVDKRNQKREAQKALKEVEDILRKKTAQEYCDRLWKFGVAAAPDFSYYGGKHTGDISVSRASLDLLLSILEAE